MSNKEGRREKINALTAALFSVPVCLIGFSFRVKKRKEESRVRLWPDKSRHRQMKPQGMVTKFFPRARQIFFNVKANKSYTVCQIRFLYLITVNGLVGF